MWPLALLPALTLIGLLSSSAILPSINLMSASSHPLWHLRLSSGSEGTLQAKRVYARKCKRAIDGIDLLRPTDARLELRLLLRCQILNRGPIFQFFLPPGRRHTQGSDNYVRVAASSASRAGWGLTLQREESLKGGGGGVEPENKKLHDVKNYSAKNKRVHLG